VVKGFSGIRIKFNMTCKCGFTPGCY
jgi:hypothetical protein